MSAPVNYALPEHCLLVLTTPVEELEAEGQAQLLASDVIPTELVGCTEDHLVALGFLLGDVVDEDPLFRHVTLPCGWSRRAAEESRGSYLVDERGSDRAFVFYKAAPYDRHATLTLTREGSARRSAKRPGRSPEPDLAVWQRGALAVLHRIVSQHAALPALRWTIPTHECGVTGEVIAPDPYMLERVFAEWRRALSLAVSAPMPDQLKAIGDIAGYRITVTATLPRKENNR